MKILITGGSGFLGSALTREFLRQGHELALMLRPTSSLRRLNNEIGKFQCVRYTTDDEVKAFIKLVRPEIVIHTACSYGGKGGSLLDLWDANFRYGLSIIETLLELRQPVTFLNTGSALETGVSNYALSKAQFSELGMGLATHEFPFFQFINISLQYMYGPGDDETKFTANVLKSCYRNVPELSLTLGNQKRDFIYIDDVVNAFVTIVAQRENLNSRSTIDVGYGTAPTVREFVETAHNLSRSKTILNFGAHKYRENEPMHCVANIDKMKRLGWEPKYSIKKGIKKTMMLEFSKLNN